MSLIFLSRHHWARASKIAKCCKISEKLNGPLLFFGTLEKIWVCFTLGRGQNLSERLPGIDQVPDTFFRLSSPNYCILQLPRNQLHWAGQRQNTLFWGRYRKKVLAPPRSMPGGRSHKFCLVPYFFSWSNFCVFRWSSLFLFSKSRSDIYLTIFCDI